MKKATALFSAAFLAVAASASAAFDLQITEIWPGNEPGSNLTEDWFEVTNLGSMPWVAATDGDLYYDDDSQDFTTADLMSGVSSIAPGESVVFVDYDDDDSDAATTLAEFASVWGPLPGVQVGTYVGSGLSQGGDGVTLFVSVGAPTGLGDIVDFETYPDAESNGGQSYNVFLGEFSSLANGASSSLISNDVSQFAFASPGALVPEPTTALLAIAAIGAFAARRR